MIHLKSYLIIVAHFKIDIYFIKHKSLRNITISSMLTYTDIIPFITDSSDKHFFCPHFRATLCSRHGSQAVS